MPELKERLTVIDRVEFPEELWSAALRRAAEEAGQQPVTRLPVRPAGRIAATVVAIAVFLATAFFLWNAFESRPQRPRPGETPAPNPLSQLPAGWSTLPDPPDVRAGSAAVWSGSKLLVWGGYEYTGLSDEEPLEDGYSLDPLTGNAEALPTAPLAARAFPAVAWTGSELIVWGGWDLHDGFFDDGAAFDPASGEWRPLPQAPIEARMPFSVWTGSELVVWGSKWRDTRLVDGAAYDPAADSWRQLADAPLELTDGTAVWTGREMIVIGAALHGGNRAESKTAIGGAYDPAADRWRLLPDSQLSPQASTAAWNGEQMIAWDYLNQSQIYDPDTDQWGPVEDVPLQRFECSPRSVSVSDSIVGDYCGQTTIYGDGGWSDISRRKYAGWGFELVAADPAALLFGSNVDAGANVLLAYRVPTGDGSTPTELSFEEAADLLAEREIFMTPIQEDGREGLLDTDAFDQLLDEWMARHPRWRVLSVHLAMVDMLDERFRIHDRPSYVIEITGPATGNCIYLFDATNAEELLGACFYPIRQ